MNSFTAKDEQKFLLELSSLTKKHRIAISINGWDIYVGLVYLKCVAGRYTSDLEWQTPKEIRDEKRRLSQMERDAIVMSRRQRRVASQLRRIVPFAQALDVDRRTPWFDRCQQQPARIGPYERNHWPGLCDSEANDREDINWAPCEAWDGEQWLAKDGTRSLSQSLPWRGLAADPRQAKATP
jgi:hypothetical protein